MTYFVDADFYIGIYNKKDAHYSHCLAIKETLKEDVITSFEVINEVVTKLSYYLTKKVALQFLEDIKNQKIPIIFPDHSLFSIAKDIIKQIKTKHVSLTDCMNMAIMKEKDIKKILSFDKIYEQNGFELVK